MRGAFLALALLAGCVSAPPPAQAPVNYLAGTEWRRVDDENANPHGATISFTEHGASGYTGCNRWFAAVTHDGEALRFGDIGTTRMACGAGVQTATERSFLAVLRATRYGHYDQDALVLLDENQQVIARFDSMR
jgi:heat shock protein HslJ